MRVAIFVGQSLSLTIIRMITTFINHAATSTRREVMADGNVDEIDLDLELKDIPLSVTTIGSSIHPQSCKQPQK